MNGFDLAFFIALLSAGVRMSVPLIFGSVGNLVAEKSGVMNIGIEGQMLIGAFFSFFVAHLTGNSLLGILAGGVSAMISVLIVGFWCITAKQDQSVVGIMFNIFALGITNFLNRFFFGIGAGKAKVDILPTVNIPFLCDIPVIGDIFFRQNILTYLSVICAVAMWIVIKKMRLGLTLSAVGENPKAAKASGISVIRTRYLSYMFSGFMAGLGGSFLTLGIMGGFTENISSGRGFICLAITILARWNPLFAVLASLCFGTTQALQLRLQAMGSTLPYQFFVAIPYLVTIVTLVIFGRNLKAPSSLGSSYSEESR